MVEKAKKKADERHQEIREKLMKDEAIHSSNLKLKEITSNKPYASPMKEAISKIKAAAATKVRESVK